MNNLINEALARMYLTYNIEELEIVSKRYMAKEWGLIIMAMHEMKGEVTQ